MGDIRANNQKTPLLDKQFPELPLSRTGNVWTAVAHIITGVIGSGVLSLSWSMAQLGWIAGPVAMLSFAITTLFSAFLLCNCYRSPDPETGPFRNRSYIEAVDMNLGKKKALACGLLLQLSLYGFGIAYTVTSGISMRAIQETNCYHKEGREATCVYGDSYYILLFGVAQIILSQIPNFHNIQWLSVVAAIMSFTYALIGLGLAAVKVIGTGYAQGSISGIPTPNAGQKVWLVSQALGDVAFSYPFSLILFEIQDTLEAPPSESETMKKASAISITITTFFYLFCGGFGYAAFGDATPGNLMTAFGSYELYWLVDLANVCIVLHLVGGYQDNVKRGQWTPEEDNKLSSYIAQHGTRNWRLIPKNAGLQRCGKSCRLRWTNYLRPDLKHGQFSDAEEQTIVKLHSIVGNRWSIIAAQLPGRTDNDVKNHWNTKLKKKLSGMGIDPVTHKPFSHLMAEIATTLEPPQVAHLAEAALGCFKDEMLHLLTKRRVDFQLQQSNAAIGNTAATYVNGKQEEHDDDTIEKIKLGLSRAIQEPDVLLPMNKLWDSAGPTFSNLSGNCSAFSFPVSGFQYEPLTFSHERDGSPWNQSMCTGSTCTVGDRQGRFPEKEENGEESRAGKEIRNEPIVFNSDSDLWDLPSDELMHPIV